MLCAMTVSRQGSIIQSAQVVKQLLQPFVSNDNSIRLFVVDRPQPTQHSSIWYAVFYGPKCDLIPLSGAFADILEMAWIFKQ